MRKIILIETGLSKHPGDMLWIALLSTDNNKMSEEDLECLETGRITTKALSSVPADAPLEKAAVWALEALVCEDD